MPVTIVALTAVVVLAYLIFRPLGPPRELPCTEQRRTATDLVHTHGHDTLAFFKLRQDAHYRFAVHNSAFLGYRVANRVLLIAGDPVGEHSAFPGLLRDTCAFAETRGLQVAAIGTSRWLLPVYRRAGLRPLYLGDEAIVDTRSFSLEGRRIRKVRQSVSRAKAAGYSAELLDHERLDPATLEELESISARWRCGAVERGFSMAMDSLRGPHHAGSVVVAARDADGRIRAFIHLVPTYGRPAMSLSFMRRDRDTPNGLMEFVVVHAIELLRERGVEEVSLNFAAFARWIADPGGPVERVLGCVVSLANPFFQIESLHRFNAKFGPRWEPRYLLYERRRSLPRVAVAALRIEGQLPKLRS
jgi:lysyl-tRNA synthetase, class II